MIARAAHDDDTQLLNDRTDDADTCVAVSSVQTGRTLIANVGKASE